RLDTVLAADEHAAAANELRAHAPLQLLEGSKQSVDRTTRRVLLVHVDANGKEPVVAPIARTSERNTVRFPLREKLIDRRHQRIGDGTRQLAIAREDPHARGIGQRGERNDGHERKLAGAEWPNGDQRTPIESPGVGGRYDGFVRPNLRSTSARSTAGGIGF